MRPGLRPFPTDLGNGDVDRLYFQIDGEYERAMAAKRAPSRSGAPPFARHRVVSGSPPRDRAHAAALAWMDRTLRAEHPERHAEMVASPEPYASEFDRIARNLQEDVVVMHRDAGGGDEAIMLHVCFPSGWFPERVAGRGFRFIHGPVPDFADSDDAVASLLAAMIERGPYLRFVWTLCADDALDHHPEEGDRRAWDAASDGWLRVERQVTVPLADVHAAVFLIRTYLYRFDSLDPGQRAVLGEAIRAMPEEVRRYKGFPREAALAALGRCGN